MKKGRGLPVVEVKGKPYDMGRQAGSKCSRRAKAYRSAIAESIAHSTGMSWERAVARARLHLPYAESFYPEFVDEIRGYSEGARIPFDDAFTLCCHELLSSTGFRGCTDVAVNQDVTLDGDVLIGHNEDWSGSQLETVVLLHARPSKKPEFVTTSYAGLVPSSGMNASGISLTGNALSPNDVRMGIPKLFPVRKALECRRIGEALEAAMPEGRASSYNNICSDRNGEIFSLEGSATDCAVLYAHDGYLVHTNHYTADKMRRFEQDPSDISCSLFRYHRATRLVQEQLGRVTLDSIASIFRDHVNRPGSVCRHPDPTVHRLDVSETIFSVVFDLTRLRAHVLKGKPCAGEYSVFQLGESR
jgi:isopenicillin-N N-acyltransferase-like protein